MRSEAEPMLHVTVDTADIENLGLDFWRFSRYNGYGRGGLGNFSMKFIPCKLVVA